MDEAITLYYTNQMTLDANQMAFLGQISPNFGYSCDTFTIPAMSTFQELLAIFT